MTKKQIIIKLYKDRFIDDQVLWNLSGSGFKKYEIIEIDKTFRKYFKKKAPMSNSNVKRN